MLTEEELKNVLILVEAGARALSAQNSLENASNILATAHQLGKKLQSLIDSSKEKVE